MKRMILALVSVMALVGIGISVPVLAASANGSNRDCVPKGAFTETTDWILVSPGAGWNQIDSRTVVDEAAIDGHIEDIHLLVWTGGPVDSAPAPGDGRWNKTQGNPQGGAHAGHEVGAPYFVAAGQSGNGDWFMKGGTVVEGRDAVTRDEFRFAFDHPAVVCEEEPPPTTPATNPPKDNPPTDNPPTDNPSTDNPSTDNPSQTRPPTDNPPKTSPPAPEIVTTCQPSRCSTTETLPDGTKTTTVKVYPKAQHEEGF